MSKSVVIIGGGASISDGIKLDLWNKLQQSNIDIYSINFAYMAMPFTPKKEIWLDTTFFRNNMDSLYALEQRGCKLETKVHAKYNELPSIKQHAISREGITPNTLYIGSNGLSGFLALSIAILDGYDTIYLLGYDFGTSSIHDTNTHFYQNELAVSSSGVRNPGVYLNTNNTIKKEVQCFDKYKQFPVTIYNVSPASNIQSFPKIDYPEFFSKISA